METRRMLNGAPGDQPPQIPLVPLPQVSIVKYRNASETNGSTSGAGMFAITRTGATTQALTVKLAAIGDATLQDDYVLTAIQYGDVSPITDTIIIPAGASSIILNLLAVDDQLIEATETANLAIVADAAYSISATQGQAFATITDNDKATVSVAASDPTASETDPTGSGMGAFTISRNSDIGALTVYFRMTGQAGLNSDYQLRKAGSSTNLGGSISFAQGETSVVVEVIPIDDTRVEPVETVVLNLSSNAGYLVDQAQSTATVNIEDNEMVSVAATTPQASETDPTGTGKGAFTITRGSGAGTMTVNFTLTTGSGQALRIDDYILRLAGSNTTLTGNSVTFSSGVQSLVLEVIPVDDALVEGNETVTLSINPANTYTIVDGQSSATVTIQDNEQQVSLIASDPTASETSPTTTGKGAFTFTRAYPVGELTVHFTVATGDNHALRTTDYVLRKQGSGIDLPGDSITFADGESSFVLEVIPVDDALAELDETVTLALVEDEAYAVHPSQNSGTVTIADNETRVSIVTSKANASETSPTSTGIGRFTITRTGSTTAALTVHFALATGDGQAIRGTDYIIRRQGTTTTITVSTITINAGQTSVVLEVVPTDDTVAEPTETVVMSLVSQSTYSINPAQTTATLNITDNEPIVSITASDATADETAPTSTGKGTFTITRTGTSSTTLNISFAIQTGEGQAVLGTDYVLRRAGTSTDITNNIITLSSGQTSVVLEVIPIDDDLVESSETVILTLQTGSNYNINANPAQTTATVTIADNENISVVASDATASETDPANAGKGSFTIVRNGSSAGELTVNFTLATGNGHALRGTDYLLRLAGSADTLTTSSVTLADGVGSVVIEVIPVDDTLKENSETVVMSLAPSEQYLINAAQTSATVTIADNETVGVVASLPNASETNPTTNGKGTFTFTRDSSTGTQTVNFTLATGTGQATRNSDYALRIAGSNTNLPGNSITFANGVTTLVLEVIPVDDTLGESDETVVLTLSNSPAYNIVTGQNTATVTLADNEPIVSLVATDATASETDPTNAGKGTVTFSRTGLTTSPLTVNFTAVTGIGQATRTSDYTLRLVSNGQIITGNTVTFAIGQSSVAVDVIPVDDNIAEIGATFQPSETVILNLSANRAYVLDSTNTSATVTIADNEPTLTINASDAAASEQGTDPAEFTITRTAPDISQPMIVNFQRGGSTTSGSDYVLRLGTINGAIITGNTVTIPAGETNVKMVLVPIDDDLTEFTEYATITLTASPSLYAPINGSNWARVTLTDNEPVISIVKTKDASETSPTTTGTGSFTIHRTGSTRFALTVNYTVAGTATAGTDYTTLSGSVIIPAGRSSVTLPVIPLVDMAVETAETVIVSLTANANYQLGTANTSATLNIADAPITPQLYFGNLTFTQSLFDDDTTTQPDGTRTGSITTQGTFISSNGRTGTYTYITAHGTGLNKNATLRLVFDGLPTLDTQNMTFTWTAQRVINLHQRQMQWLPSAGGASGSFSGNNMIQAGGQLVDMNGFFKLV